MINTQNKTQHTHKAAVLLHEPAFRPNGAFKERQRAPEATF